MKDKILTLRPELIDLEIDKIDSINDKKYFCEQSIKSIRFEKSKLIDDIFDIYSSWDLDYLGRIEFAIKYLERKCLLFVSNDLEN